MTASEFLMNPYKTEAMSAASALSTRRGVTLELTGTGKGHGPKSGNGKEKKPTRGK